LSKVQANDHPVCVCHFVINLFHVKLFYHANIIYLLLMNKQLSLQERVLLTTNTFHSGAMTVDRRQLSNH